MFSSMSGQEIVNVCHPETEREEILFQAINDLLDRVSDLEDEKSLDTGGSND